MMLFDFILTVFILICLIKSRFGEWMYIASIALGCFAFYKLYIAGHPFAAFMVLMIEVISLLLIKNYFLMIYPEKTSIVRYKQYKQPVAWVITILFGGAVAFAFNRGYGIGATTNKLEVFNNGNNIHFLILSFLLILIIRKVKWI